jgi:hypothetical protein
MRRLGVLLCFALQLLSTPASFAAEGNLLTACRVVTEADANRFIGGPFEVYELPEVKTEAGPGTYNSVCSYFTKDANYDNMLAAQRVLDLTLHILDTSEATAALFDQTLVQYQKAMSAPDTPYKNATFTPVTGLGTRAFLLEAVTDSRTGYRSALLVFYKGRIAGSVAAWKKPEPPVELTKAVGKFVIDRLPQ